MQSTLEPVWAPRRHGVLAEGWDETGFEGVVQAGETLALGYASPAEPVEPPVELLEEPEHGGHSRENNRSVHSREETSITTAKELVRTLGDSRPQREVVPAQRACADQSNQSSAVDIDVRDLASWLDAVDQRLDEAEQLTSPSDAEDAREAIATAGGLEEIRRLAAQLATDRHQLERLIARQQSLCDRLDSTEIPIRTLERLR